MHPKLPEDFMNLPDDELIAVLKRCFQMTVEAFMIMASAVKEIDRRGLVVTGDAAWLIGYLRQIANGALIAGVVLRFMAKPMLLNRIATLAIVDQDRLAAGEMVEICIGKDHAKINPLEMSVEQINLVFPAGRIRAVEEQRVLLLSRSATQKPVRTTVTIEFNEDEMESLAAKAVVRGETIREFLSREVRKKKIV